MEVEKFLDRLNELYLPPTKQFTIIDVPEVRYGVITGKGSPQSPDFQEAKKWLYSVAHILKPYVKKQMGKRYTDPPLEYLFWAADPHDFSQGNTEKWHWRVMIVIIDWISNDRFQTAAREVEQKLGPAPGSVELIEIQEGQSVQIMHIGDYSQVQEICNQLYGKFLPENNLSPAGPYHEIYLNDPDRTAPDKRRMVIRQPVEDH